MRCGISQYADQLGGRFDLGVVFTFIAGLLNVLAIYDACQGPAYEDDEQFAGVAAPATRTV